MQTLPFKNYEVFSSGPAGPGLMAHRFATWRDSECDHTTFIVKETVLLEDALAAESDSS